MRTKILVLYHFYYPDDVVSAREFSDLCEGIVERGFNVEVWAGNRACHDPSASYGPSEETIRGVKIRRFWRPAFNQHSFLGRIINSIWLQNVWFWKLLFTFTLKPDIIMTGTDPLLLVLATPFFKLIRPKAKMVHWAFDLYPEAAVADGLVSGDGLLVKTIRFFLRRAYASCDLIADLGPCMRRLLVRYDNGGEVGQPVSVVKTVEEKFGIRNEELGVKSNSNGRKHITLTPWALEEPVTPLASDRMERKLLFGDSSLGLLYSGSFGRAHEFELILKLARMLGNRAAFAYSVRGSRLEELKNAISANDQNIRFAEFASPDQLSARLSSPDIHIVSLRPQWNGTVVPSKFFGVLAIGRPVLFEGDSNSDISQWIRKYKVGWNLQHDNLQSTAEELIRFSKDTVNKAAMYKHCHTVYQEHFSKKAVIDKWEGELNQLIQLE